MTMHFRTGSFWQIILVWSLFLGSMAVLFVNSIVAFFVPAREQLFRDRIHNVCWQMAALASDEFERSRESTASPQRLEEITRTALENEPGIEGGFYLTSLDEFWGYAFPTDAGPAHRHDPRRQPPPKEEPYIRLQARQTATQMESQPVLQARDVGPSRIIVATAAVGTDRPAKYVVWMMCRVTGPEQQRQQMFRYQISTVMALGGIVTALALTLTMRQNLQRERQTQERLREELRRSEHLASLGLLVAQVAHEVRNPLAGIRSTIQLWQRLPAQTQTPESMQTVIKAVDHLDALLTNLLQFSRAERKDHSNVEFNSLIRETVELLRVESQRQRVEIVLNLEPRIPTLQGSVSGLRQVVLNLAMNALQVMSDGGRLTIQTRYDEPQGAIMMEITDTGPGIDPTVRTRLFEPFFTTREHGTGLGLALCREILLQHKGAIELVPVLPHGTRCVVTLPVS